MSRRPPPMSGDEALEHGSSWGPEDGEPTAELIIALTTEVKRLRAIEQRAREVLAEAEQATAVTDPLVVARRILGELP